MSKLVIAGSRDLVVSVDCMARRVERFAAARGWNPTDIEVVSGAARGVDACGELYSMTVLGRKAKQFPADWSAHGKAAGDIRNEQMARYADAALIFFNGRPSPGSSNMLAWMKLLRKPVYTVLM